MPNTIYNIISNKKVIWRAGLVILFVLLFQFGQILFELSHLVRN